ncbi:outer-membrane lipoprotein carrier protein LolA [Beijerinckia mobilis]|uniref:outer-membrane lipoprotein carrier protein LolA n=1 Tax=Beijerinckia mobilis TaxID=231434 RepID=UPI00054D11DC|nr:outer-membrane lipoprotein carrier protein LolA [Beijerinckia mobilis]
MQRLMTQWTKARSGGVTRTLRAHALLATALTMALLGGALSPAEAVTNRQPEAGPAAKQSGKTSSQPSMTRMAAAKPATPAKPSPAPAPAPAFIPMDEATAIQKANAYFSSATTMVGDFVQVGSDGRRTEGKLYVQRPGRLRFEYALPATLEIVADGLSLAIHDRRTATKDVYFISQTPLKFLLKDQVDLARDVKVVEVVSDPSAVTIVIEDKATFGGTSRINLVFDPVKFTLKQWKVTDPQGYETLVSLFNLDLSKKPDPGLFQLSPDHL